MCFRVAGVEDTSDLERRVAAIAALDQPLRRDLYRLLSKADGWISRDEAATALGVGRPVAAFHLDKLVEAGVVEIRFERLTGRSGPGAGRPAKLYRPRQVDLAASVPERHYDLAGSLLAAAVADAAESGKPVVDCLAAVAHATGRQIGTEARESGDDQGSVLGCAPPATGTSREPSRAETSCSRNCPFHRLAEEHRSLVCAMNLDFLAGLLEGVSPAGGLSPRLQPEPGYCCVRIAT